MVLPIRPTPVNPRCVVRSDLGEEFRARRGGYRQAGAASRSVWLFNLSQLAPLDRSKCSSDLLLTISRQD